MTARRILLAAVALCLYSVAAIAQTNTQEQHDNQPVKPFRIIGNVYYVGVTGVSAFLITTPQGSILLDGGFVESAPLIEKSIEELGFKLADVKYLLNSHAHHDHAGGLAELQKRTGAKIVVSAGDAPDLALGRNRNAPDFTFPPIKADRTVKEGDIVKIDDVVMTAHITAGHTPGCTTWTMPVNDAGKNYNIVFYCSTSVAANNLAHHPEYPSMIDDYERSFATLKKMPCDVFLGPHGSFFDLEGKRKKLGQDGPNPFVVPGEMQRFIDQSQRDFEAALKKAGTSAPSR